MQAIITKYFGPSEDGKGSRIKAKCERGSITIPFSYEAPTPEAAHREAAHALINKGVEEDIKEFGHPIESWKTPFVTGSIPSGEYVHVFVA